MPDGEDTVGLTKESLPEVCLPAEVQEFFRIGEATFKRWISSKNRLDYFPNSYKIGNGWRIPKQDILNLAEKMYGTTKRN